MKNFALLAAVSTTFFSTAWAKPLVVYGEDNRQEVYEAIAAHQLLARSTAILMPSSEIDRESSEKGSVQIAQTTLKEWLETLKDESAEASKGKLFSSEVSKAVAQRPTFCPETRFVEQPNPGVCSGFLIGPDLLVTAGHCVEQIENFCSDYEWVFDFNLDKDSQTAGIDFKEENIYQCKKVVSHALVDVFGLDYGVIQLDRVVKGRAPLEIRSDSKVPDNQSLLVIGGPSGLPTKVSAGANVRLNTLPTYFSANLDTFEGNSGSGVFNADTGVVEGILVRGEEDYVANLKNSCVEVFKCADSACHGEDVSRMTSIPEVANQKALYAAAQSGNVKEIEAILSKRVWVDFYTKDGQSALIKATIAEQNEALKFLIEKKANVNLQDAEGNSALHKLAEVLSKENQELLSTLIEAGAKLELENEVGETAVQIAERLKNQEGMDLLIAAGAIDLTHQRD